MVAWRVMFISLFAAIVRGDAPPGVMLKNAAQPGTLMPAVGLGTGGYALAPSGPGEYWDDSVSQDATASWLAKGGRRIDTALDYNDQTGIGKALAAAIASGTVTREEVFITSKVGGGPPGYNETLEQMEKILSTLQVTYVDLLLIHWPGPVIGLSSTDPNCKHLTDGPQCRQSTWRAMEKIFKDGGAKAIGVSNFETKHLQSIIDMKSLLPAVNQVEFHIYWHEDDLVAFCRSLNITFNGYAPLGTPDWAPKQHHWNCSQLELPLVKSIATKYNKSPAQVLLRWEWQQEIPVNPRSMNHDHHSENLDIFDFALTAAEMDSLANVPKPTHPKSCPDPSIFP